MSVVKKTPFSRFKVFTRVVGRRCVGNRVKKGSPGDKHRTLSDSSLNKPDQVSMGQRVL